MVQVLPYVPSFGEKLAPVLSQAIGDVAQGFKQKSARERFHSLLNPPAPTGEGEAPMDQMNAIGAQSAQRGPLPTGLKGIELVRAAEQAYGPDAAKYIGDYIGDLRKAELKEDAKIRQDERDLLQPANKAFYEKIQKDRDSLSEKELAVEAISQGIQSGETGVWSSANIGSWLGSLTDSDELRKALETPGSKEFKSASKTILAANMRDTFRGNTTNREISIGEQIGPEIGINENANKASVALQEVKNQISRAQIRLTDELLESGVAPSRIPSIVNKRLDPFIKELKGEYFNYVDTLGFKGNDGKAK